MDAQPHVAAKDRLLSAAYGYADRGLAVVPVPRRGYQWTDRDGKPQTCGGKGPIGRNWQTRKPGRAQVRGLFAPEHIEAIGIVTGKLSNNLVILDFDGEGWAGAFEHVLTCWQEWNRAPIVKTGSGRRHIWLRVPDLPPDFTHHEYERTDLRAVIDLRGNNTQTLAPPSVHPSGERYEWATDAAEIIDVSFAEITHWLADWAGEQPIPANGNGHQHAAPVAERITQGKREPTLFSIACSMRVRALPDSAILAALLEVNRERCDPPHTEEAVAAIVERSARYKVPDADTVRVAGAEPVSEQITTPPEPEAPPDEIELRTVKPLAALELLTYAEVLQPPPPVEWVVHDLLVAGGLSIMFGEGGTKKTWIMLDIACAVVSGQPWLGRETTPCPVLLIDEESGRARIWRRLNHVGRGHELTDPVTPIMAACMSGFNFTQQDHADLLHEQITRTGARLCMIDSLAATFGGADENAVGEMQPVMNRLRKTADDTGCHIMLLHHANKLGGYRGSSALKAAVDLMLTVQSDRSSTEIRFDIEKSRDGDPAKFQAQIYFDPERVWLAPYASAIEDTLPGAQSFVLRYLRGCGGTATITDIRNSADTCSAASARDAVYALAARGLIVRVDDGGRGRAAIYRLVDDNV